MEIDIVGEDAVTQAILEKLLKVYRKDIIIKSKLPARGGQIKKNAPKYNLLDQPLILLTDLDEYNCPPELIKKWFGNDKIRNQFLFRVAQEEAESWLMADREGFARWLGINLNLIPLATIIDKRKGIIEILFPYKPSLYMMKELASKSKKKKIKEELMPLDGASKGPGYNVALLPFIEKHWNINNAMKNSYSLKKAVQRIQEFN